jgi:hypothetical protein
MARYQAPFEIHVHGDVVLGPNATVEQVQEALMPLWKYGCADSFLAGAARVIVP